MLIFVYDRYNVFQGACLRHMTSQKCSMSYILESIKLQCIHVKYLSPILWAQVHFKLNMWFAYANSLLIYILLHLVFSCLIMGNA